MQLADEALSIAIVFRSPQGAKRELGSYSAEFEAALDADGSPPATRFGVPHVPGAIGLSQLGRDGGGAANVLFRSGRCFFLIGVSLEGSLTGDQLMAAPIAGAGAVLRRAEASCA